jgi:hypothetical protein
MQANMKNTVLIDFLDNTPISETRAFKIAKVDRSTWQRWKNGITKPPQTTLELIELYARFEPPSVENEWRGWCIRQGKIFTPSNRGFTPCDIIQIPSLYRDRAILENLQKRATIQYNLFE